MSATMVLAIVSGIVAIGSIVLTAHLQSRQRRSERAETREEAAQALLSRYRDPLLDAAFQLQSRLWNICAQGFLEVYLVAGDEAERRYARESTQWLVAQFLGWMEILRRDAQYLDLGEIAQSHALGPAIEEVRGVLRTDALRDRGLRIFFADQRAIGELMITAAGDATSQPSCLGYAQFARHLPTEEFQRWLAPLGKLEEYLDVASRTRLVRLQHALVDLINSLDPHDARIPVDKRGKLRLFP